MSQRGQITVGPEDVCARASSREVDADRSRLKRRSNQKEDVVQVLTREVLKVLRSPEITEAFKTLPSLKLSLVLTPDRSRLQTFDLVIQATTHRALEAGRLLLLGLSKVFEEWIGIESWTRVAESPDQKTSTAPEHGRRGDCHGRR